jgi:hypothetical protein
MVPLVPFLRQEAHQIQHILIHGMMASSSIPPKVATDDIHPELLSGTLLILIENANSKTEHVSGTITKTSIVSPCTFSGDYLHERKKKEVGFENHSPVERVE